MRVTDCPEAFLDMLPGFDDAILHILELFPVQEFCSFFLSEIEVPKEVCNKSIEEYLTESKYLIARFEYDSFGTEDIRFGINSQKIGSLRPFSNNDIAFVTKDSGSS